MTLALSMPMKQAMSSPFVFDIPHTIESILSLIEEAGSYAESAMITANTEISKVQEKIASSQLVMQTKKQIEEYEKLVEQANTLIDQYEQMEKDYQQVMTEYDHMVNQMTGLQDDISDADWQSLTGTVVKSYGDGDFALTAILDPNAADYSESLRTVLSSAKMSTISTQDFAKLATLSGVDKKYAEGAADEIDETYQKYANQQQQVALNNTNMNVLEDRRGKNVKKLENLGSESQLATLQFIAAQQAFAAEQTLQQMTISNQLLQAYEPESNKRAKKANVALVRQLNRQYVLNQRKYTGKGVEATDLGL